MGLFSLAEAAEWLGLPGGYEYSNLICSGVSTDTRTLQPGDLFVALKGQRIDGHHLLSEARGKGAVAALVCRDSVLGDETGYVHPLPSLQVADTLQALGRMAIGYRKQFSPIMCALTGSYGKTSTKELLFHMLSTQGKTLATRGNLNTEVGVPLMLFELEASHQYAVLEMGARHPGDIATLTRLIEPQTGILLNAGLAHREIFGTDEAIAEAKGEMIEYLAPEGTLVLNADSPWFSRWKQRGHNRRIISFGIEKKADVMASSIKFNSDNSEMTFVLEVENASVPVHLALVGEHAVSNALAAAAAAYGLGVPPDAISHGLERARAITGRLYQCSGLNGSIILDDTYNANPASQRAALEVLARFPGEKIFVMGDMFELGQESHRLHQEVGRTAKRLGIDRMLGIGTQTLAAVDAFGASALFFESKSVLIEALRPLLSPHTVVLVKGSRGMHMEEIVETIVETLAC